MSKDLAPSILALGLPPYYFCALVGSMLDMFPFDVFTLVLLPAVFLFTVLSIPGHGEWPKSGWRFLLTFGLSYFVFCKGGQVFGGVLLASIPLWISHFNVQKMERFVETARLRDDLNRRFPSE